MKQSILTREACNALRGLAIIGIFLHNYCHWLGPIVKENEYQYIQHNVDWLAQVIVNPDFNLPIHLLSFFGHYGVPVFLFLSAYGLVMKYEAKPHLSAEQEAQIYHISGEKSAWRINWREPLRFVRYHYLKLFKMMITGLQHSPCSTSSRRALITMQRSTLWQCWACSTMYCQTQTTSSGRDHTGSSD